MRPANFFVSSQNNTHCNNAAMVRKKGSHEVPIHYELLSSLCECYNKSYDATAAKTRVKRSTAQEIYSRARDRAGNEDFIDLITCVASSP